MVVQSGPRCAQRPKSTGLTLVSYNLLTNHAHYNENTTSEKWLSQPRTVRICRVITSVCLTGHKLELGEVDPVVFDHLPRWWLIGECAVTERSQFMERLLYEFRLLDVRLIDSCRFPPWRPLTGSGRPDRSPMCYVRKGRNRLGQPRLVAIHQISGRHIGNRSRRHIKCVIRMRDAHEFDIQRKVTHRGML